MVLSIILFGRFPGEFKDSPLSMHALTNFESYAIILKFNRIVIPVGHINFP